MSTFISGRAGLDSLKEIDDTYVHVGFEEKSELL